MLFAFPRVKNYRRVFYWQLEYALFPVARAYYEQDNNNYLSPHKYLLNIRLTQAKFLLIQTNINISEIGKSVGYDDPFYFSRIFKKILECLQTNIDN